jgi:hypothetical protein
MNEASGQGARERARATPDAPGSGGAAARARLEDLAWRRVRAGLTAEAGLVPPDVLAHWRVEARGPGFDPDACADDLLASAEDEDARARVEARSGALLRELLVAGEARGRSGRRRRRARSGIAMLVYQGYMLVVWSGLVLAGLLLMRMRGFGLDAFLDRLLAVFR